LTGTVGVTNLRLPGQYDERLFAAVGICGLKGPVACRQVPPKDVPPWKYDRKCWLDCFKSTRTMCMAPRLLSSGALAWVCLQVMAPELGYPLAVLCEILDDKACEAACAIKPPEPQRPHQPPACGK
jgi:hypothetical protein